MNPDAKPFTPMPRLITQSSTINQPHIVIVYHNSYKYFQHEFDRCISEIQLIHPKVRAEIMVIAVDIHSDNYAIISTGSREIICSADRVLQIIAEEVNNVRPTICYALGIKKFTACCKVIVCPTVDFIFERQYNINFNISTARLGVKSNIIKSFANLIADELSSGRISDKMSQLCSAKIPGVDIRKILRDPRFEILTGFRYNLWLGDIYKFSSREVIL